MKGIDIRVKNKRLIHGILVLAVIGVISISGCIQQPLEKGSILTTGDKLEGEDCRQHSECRSGVCDHYKKDHGKCAPTSCETGKRSDNNNFFCNENGEWDQSNREGESCAQDYGCHQPTCFMIPACDLTDIPRTRARCKDKVCVYEIEQDECDKQGLKRILTKEDCGSMAQRTLSTTCAPCGNGACDKEIESECNCPEDCK